MKIKYTHFVFFITMIFLPSKSKALAQLEVHGKATKNSDPVVFIETNATGGEPIGLQSSAV
jgi:hypothetical protein